MYQPPQKQIAVAVALVAIAATLALAAVAAAVALIAVDCFVASLKSPSGDKCWKKRFYYVIHPVC